MQGACRIGGILPWCVHVSKYLLLSDAAARPSESENARALWALGRGLISLDHSVRLLTVTTGEAAGRIPGLARRLRKVVVNIQGAAYELGFFEGQSGASEPSLTVVSIPDNTLIAPGVWLEVAVESIASDPLLSPDAVIAWGEGAAGALAGTQSNAKFFVLPEGRVQDAVRASAGAAAANAILVPGPAAAARLEKDPALSGRASDEPIVAFRVGADDPPHDPVTDAALPAHFSSADLGGKLVCRKAVERRLGLALDPQTLLLTVAELRLEMGGEAVVDALVTALRGDVAIVATTTGGDRRLIERIRVLAIENPSKVALLHPESDSTPIKEWEQQRLLLAAVDAVIVSATHEQAARSAGLSLRYGSIPIASAQGVAGGHLIDLDAFSCTGNAILFPEDSANAIANSIVRAASLHRDSESWTAMIKGAMATAPTWKHTAGVFERLRERAEAGLDDRLAV